MVVNLTNLVRILYNLLMNRPNEIFFTHDNKGEVTSIVGSFHVYTYVVPEQGLRVEDIGAIKIVFSRMFRDRLSAHFAWIIRRNRLVYLLLFIPVSKTPPPSYIREYGFEEISAANFNEIIREVFGIENTAMYLPI